MKRIAIFILLTLAGSDMFGQKMDNKNTTLIWDTSLSMKDRDLNKDFSVLEKVFSRVPDQEVQLILFNISTEEKTYHIKDGNWQVLKNDLEAVVYDGANVYALINGVAKHPNIYLFTDGNRVYETDAPNLPEKSFLINSSPYRDEEFLKRTALINRNRLMDFAAILPENIGSLKKKESGNTLMIKGKVYVNNTPAPDVVISVKGNSNAIRSLADGSFNIQAQPGDSLIVSSRANNSYKVIPIEGEESLVVFLEANVVSLEEVVLIEKRQEDGAEITTAFGKENVDKVGYAIQTIDQETITPIQTDVSQAVINKFSNVNLGNTEDLSKATMRSNTSILNNNYSLVVIDGVPQRQSDSSRGAGSQTSFDYVNPDNIASISVLKGYAATNKYGSLGANGVILITTKAAMTSKQNEELIDQARLTDNIYSEPIEDSAAAVSEIRKKLEMTSSLAEAYSIYTSIRTNSASNMNFFYEGYDYFKTRSPEKAAVIISSVLELFPNDMSTLRGVALALSSLEYHEEVIRINNEILRSNKNNVQAYLDIALAKRGLKEHQKAVDLLLDLDRGQKYPSLNTTGIRKTLKREMRNLVHHERNVLNTSQLPPELLNNVKYNVRLVFEWNDPEAEFNLQFVNPQKRFFNWEHNRMTSAERIKDEILNGYTSEEFEFYGEGVQGKWILNATYLDNIDATNREPLVLKCTLYQNFGYPDQSVEEIVVHFNTPDETKQLRALLVK
jgi:TonB-dependent SusC/RagA subfamily outer membrane receptor